MAKIWANRIIAGTKTWSEVPKSRQDDVRAELERRLENGEITEEQFNAIFAE